MKKLTSILLSVLLLFSLSACGQKESAPTWQEQYDLGVRYLSEGNYEEAIIAFTAAIEIDPKNADAYLGMADAYIAQGNIDAANEVLTNALVAVEDTTVIQARLDELAKQKETKVDSEPEVQPEVVLEPEPQPQPEPEPEPQPQPEPEPEPKPQPEPEPQPEPTPEPQPQPESESESEAYVEPAFVTWQAQMEQLAQREDAEQVSRVDISGDDITDISALSKLKNLTDISLSYTMVSDISALSGLTNVTRLYLAYNNISDISALRGLTNLRNLNLSGNSVSDISALSKLTNLTTLMLVNNNISDISALGGLTSLTTLWLSGNDLTQQQVDELQAKLPNCEIVFQP